MSVSAEAVLFQQPVIRHLAWLCQAPQLYQGDLSFDPSVWLPEGYLQKLQYWDQHPAAMPAVLQQPPPRRLGRYFEQLYACLLQDLLGWDMLARNLQIQHERRTLGELDFLVRNPRTDAIEHHEVAVKFYLGHRDTETGAVLWYGPNSRDRLDLKTARLLQHQARLTTQPAAQVELQALGVCQMPTPRIFMPGYLFQPLQNVLQVPSQVEPGHGQGRWCYASEASTLIAEGWVVLHKPHWLADWHQPLAPEAGILHQTVKQVAHTGRAGLLARLTGSAEGWREVERLFMVPDSWPAVPSKG